MIATFRLSSAAFLNLGQFQNGVLGNGLNRFCRQCRSRSEQDMQSDQLMYIVHFCVAYSGQSNIKECFSYFKWSVSLILHVNPLSHIPQFLQCLTHDLVVVSLMCVTNCHDMTLAVKVALNRKIIKNQILMILK